MGLSGKDRGYHSLAWLHYGYLQLGQFDKAAALLKEMIEYNYDQTASNSYLIMMQNQHRIESGVWPDSLEFQGFHLLSGTYVPIEPNQEGHLWSQQLGLFLGVHNKTLRFFTADGELVPTPEETAEQAQQQGQKLADKLRELGVNPDEL